MAIGSVYVDVFPSAAGFVQKMRDDVLRGADAVGRELGQKIGQQATSGVRSGIENGVKNASTTAAAARQGRTSGDAFGREIRSAITRALSNLPEAEIKGQSKQVRADIEEVRKLLASVGDKSINFRSDIKGLLAGVTAAQKKIDALRGKDVKARLNFDLDRAQAELKAFQGRIASEILDRQRKDVDRQSGFLATAVKKQLRDAVAGIPPAKIGADVDPARRELEAFQAEAKALLDGIDLDPNVNLAEVFAKLKALQTSLRAISDNKGIDIGIRADTGKFLAQLKAISARDFSVTAEVQPRIGAFREKLRAEIDAARASLPSTPIDLNARLDDRQARLEIIALDERLANLSNDIRVGMDSGAAEAELVKLQTEFEALSRRKITPELEFNIAGALERVRAAVDQTGRRSGASFGNEFKDALRTAFANLPDPRIDINYGGIKAELDDIRRQLSSLGDQRIGIDIDEGPALVKIRDLQARLAQLARSAPTATLKAEAAQAYATLEAFLARANSSSADIKVDVNAGGFRSKLIAAVEKAAAGLPEVPVGVDVSRGVTELDAFRARLKAISVDIAVGADPAKVRRDLAQIKAEAKALLRSGVDLPIQADTKGLIRDLAAARAAALGIAAATDGVVGGTQRWRLILAVIVALLPLIAGALLGISAVLFLIIAPVLAIAAGLQGIGKAAAPLKDDFAALQTAASQAFEQNLGPAISNVEKLLQGLRVPIAQTAIQLSDMATRVTAVVSSSAGLATVQRIFSQINVVIDALTPAIATFVENILKLADVGSVAMVSFGAQLSGVARDFGTMIDRLNATGTAQAAIQALFQVLSSLIGLIGPLTELGAVMAVGFGPALSAALDLIGGALTVLANILAALPGPVQTAVTAFILLRTVMFVLGGTLPTVANALARFGTAGTAAGVGALRVSTAVSGLITRIPLIGPAAVRAGSALLGAFGGGVGLAITALVVGLSLFGQAQANAAAATEATKQQVQGFADALRESGGAITSRVLDLTNQALASANAGEQMKTLGLNTNEVSAAVAAGGDSFNQLRQRLVDASNAGLTFNGTQEGSVNQMTASNEAAMTLLGVVDNLRANFTAAAQANQVLADALRITGSSMVGGLANAKLLEGSLATLRDTSAATSDKVKALKDALDALNGGTLTAQEATIKFQEQIDNLAKSLTDAKDSATKTKESLLDTVGGFNLTSEGGRIAAKALLDLRDAGLTAATTAFDAAGGLTNLGGATEAAAAKIQEARDAAIGFAESAGLSKDQAAAYADSLNLIPAQVSTLLKTAGVDTARQELNQLSNLILNQVPGTKTVTVDALTEPARKLLDSLGIQVTQLPNGKFEVGINDQTGPALAAAVSKINNTQTNLPVGAEVTPFNATIDAQIAALQQQKADLPVQARFERQELDSQIGQLRAQKNTLNFDANTATVLQQLEAVRQQINTTVGTLQIDGNKVLATDALAAVLTAIAQGKASVNIDGNKVPVNDALAQVLNLIGQSNAKVTIGGIDTPARDVLLATLGAIAAGRENVTINGVDAPARDVLARLLGTIGLSKESVTALLNDTAARAALNELTRPRTTTLTVNVVQQGVNNAVAAKGNRLAGGAIGGIVKPMAGGGMLTPMSGKIAQIIAPNTWRVIGDRITDDEAFIPINNSARSKAILTQTAGRFGYSLVPAGGDGAALPVTSLSTQQTGQFTATQNKLSSVRTQMESLLSGANSEPIEKKLDALIAAVGKSRNVPPITVEDRSGNPTETARSVQLAIRLAR